MSGNQPGSVRGLPVAMSSWTRGLLACGASVLGIAAIGVGVGYCSLDNPQLVQGAASFATVSTGWLRQRFDQRLVPLFSRASWPLPTDENPVILRGLRSAQLSALRTISTRFDRARRSDNDPSRRSHAELFMRLLGQHLDRERNLPKRWLSSDLPEPTDADIETLRFAVSRHAGADPTIARARTVRRASEDLSAALSIRHGGGPNLDRFRVAAEAAMLAELAAAVHPGHSAGLRTSVAWRARQRRRLVRTLYPRRSGAPSRRSRLSPDLAGRAGRGAAGPCTTGRTRRRGGAAYRPGRDQGVGALWRDAGCSGRHHEASVRSSAGNVGAAG